MHKRIRLAAIALNLSLLIAGVAGGALLFTAMNDQRDHTLDAAARAGTAERVDWNERGNPPLDLSGLLTRLGPTDPDPTENEVGEKELREAVEAWVWLRRLAHGPEGTLASVWCDGHNYLVAENERMKLGTIDLVLTAISRDGITVQASTDKLHVTVTLGFHDGALPWTDEPYYGPIDGPVFEPDDLRKHILERPIDCPPEPKLD